MGFKQTPIRHPPELRHHSPSDNPHFHIRQILQPSQSRAQLRRNAKDPRRWRERSLRLPSATVVRHSRLGPLEASVWLRRKGFLTEQTAQASSPPASAPSSSRGVRAGNIPRGKPRLTRAVAPPLAPAARWTAATARQSWASPAAPLLWLGELARSASSKSSSPSLTVEWTSRIRSPRFRPRMIGTSLSAALDTRPSADSWLLGEHESLGRALACRYQLSMMQESDARACPLRKPPRRSCRPSTCLGKQRLGQHGMPSARSPRMHLSPRTIFGPASCAGSRAGFPSSSAAASQAN
mmetsp:Transcript_16570/g.62995  ORF Transcript_16570/g.62995 Transcript_16570/m.62995 type:complete len:295 (+) Transcript_16570:1426-2310(+)|eukprot:scaffold723_cov370-Pinguiococcus_pyrenoidosus.AAC.3